MEYEKFSDNHQYITLLLKGPSGAGKTTLAAQLPNVGLLNLDNNLSCLRKLPKEVTESIKIMSPTRAHPKNTPPIKIWKSIMDAIETMAVDPEIDTLVVDSLTTLSGYLIDRILGTSDAGTRMEIQHYGDFLRYIKKLGDDFLCASDLDKNIVFIAHEEIIVHNDLKGNQKIRYELSIPTKVKNNFELYFTDCWRCSVENKISGGPVYKIRTLGSEAFNAKCSLDLPTMFEFKEQKAKIISAFSPPKESK